MYKDIVAASFALFKSVESTPVSIEQVNDFTVTGVDKLPCKLTFSNNFMVACMEVYTENFTKVFVYTLNPCGVYKQVIHC